MEKNIKQLIRTTFFAAKTRVIFTSKSFLTPRRKDQISKFDKNIVIYQFDSYCDISYIGLTTRQLKNSVKDHIPTCVYNFLMSAEKEIENKSVKILNAVKIFHS